MQSSTVAYFVGNGTGMNAPDENAAEARLGVAGLGWQLNGSASNWTTLEEAEVATARRLKALRPGVKVLVGRNTEVVAPFYRSVARYLCSDDPATCKVLNESYAGWWLKDKDGKPIVGSWDGPGLHATKVLL